MHFYTNPSEVPVFFFSPAKRPLHFAKMQSNAQTAPRTGAQKSQKDDGGLRCTGAASSGRKFQVPSTSTTASTSTSRSGSGSGSRSPKLRRCAPAKKAEKSARKIRVASLCLCVCVCVCECGCVCPKFGATFLTECPLSAEEGEPLRFSDALATHKEMGQGQNLQRAYFHFLRVLQVKNEQQEGLLTYFWKVHQVTLTLQ